MINREKHTHVVDADGIILESDLRASKSIVKQELVGTCIDEYLEPRDIIHYMHCLRSAIKHDVEYCKYTIRKHDLLCRMERMSSYRVRVIEVDVTGMDQRLDDVLKLF